LSLVFGRARYWEPGIRPDPQGGTGLAPERNSRTRNAPWPRFGPVLTFSRLHGWQVASPEGGDGQVVAVFAPSTAAQGQLPRLRRVEYPLDNLYPCRGGIRRELDPSVLAAPPVTETDSLQKSPGAVQDG